MKTSLLILVLLHLAFGSSTLAGEASTRHWRAQMKLAQEAQSKRDFQRARTILEGVAAEASELGPLTSAENSAILADVYSDLNMREEALQTVEGELAKIDANPTEEKLQIIRGILLAIRSTHLMESGRYDDALKSADDGRAVLEKVAGKYHPELFRLNIITGNIHFRQRNYIEAEKSFRAALKMAESQSFVVQTRWSGFEESTGMYRVRPPADGVVRSASALSDVYFVQGNFKEAESTARKALKSAEAIYGKKSPMVIMPLNRVAMSELKQGKRKEFERDTDRSYEIASKARGFEPWVVEPLWNRLDAELAENNETAAAQTARRITSVFAVNNFDTGPLAQRALEIASTNEPPNWARIRQVQDLFSGAIAAEFGTDVQKAGPVYLQFGKFANDHGQTDLATTAFEELVKTQRNATNKILLISALSKLSETRLSQNKVEEALALRRQITEALRQQYGSDARVADSMDEEAALFKKLGQEQGASELKAKAAEVRTKAFGRK